MYYFRRHHKRNAHFAVSSEGIGAVPMWDVQTPKSDRAIRTSFKRSQTDTTLFDHVVKKHKNAHLNSLMPINAALIGEQMREPEVLTHIRTPDGKPIPFLQMSMGGHVSGTDLSTTPVGVSTSAVFQTGGFYNLVNKIPKNHS